MQAEKDHWKGPFIMQTLIQKVIQPMLSVGLTGCQCMCTASTIKTIQS